jgi:FHA domain
MDPMMPLTAPPDAGAGSGKAASSKPSVADQLHDVDTSVLDRLNTIREEESRLAAFRTRASEMKGQVSDQVYRRVVDDYNKRATSLEQQATPLKTKGRAEYRKLHVLTGDVTRIRDQARLEKEELEFRHAVGELDDGDLRTGLESPQGRLDQCEADLARIEEYANRFIEAFGSKEALDAPEPVAPPPPPARSPGVTAKPAPSTAPAPPPIVVKSPAPPPADLDATAYMPTSPSDTAPPLGPPPDLTMIVPDDATRLMPAGGLPPPTPPAAEEFEGQTILVPMAALIAEPGSMPQTEYRLGAVNYLGRAEDNQVQIMSPEVSRKHAVITAVGSGFELKDLGSQNGVNVNGVRTNLRTLVDGDRVEIAGIALVFRSPWPARPSKVSGATGKAAAAKR